MKRERISLETARERCMENIIIDRTEEMIPLEEGLGRMLAQDVTAIYAQPPFDRSPLDGYAYDASCVSQGEALKVGDVICAGTSVSDSLSKGEAAPIMTGAPIPVGANCVIRQEDTRREGDYVYLQKNLMQGENICKAGEDVAQGAVLAEEGTLLTSLVLSAFAAQGMEQVSVYRRPKIGILTTGSELSKEHPLPKGKIYDCNAVLLKLRCKELGCECQHDWAEDDPEIIKEYLKLLTEKCDMVLTTGGVSVGAHDWMPTVMEKMGAKILFHGIDCKPGMPTMAAVYEGKPVICLSGNPAAAETVFELLAVPLIGLLVGKRLPKRSEKMLRYRGVSWEEASMERYYHGKLVDGFAEISEKMHSPGRMARLKDCNGLIHIPAGKKVQEGDLVEVCPILDHVDWEKRQVPVVFVCGEKNTGKTTLLEKLIPMFLKRGIRLSVIKHDGHDFVPDVEGTDSFRFRKAGAKWVYVYSSHQRMEVEQLPADFAYVLQQAKEQADLVLVEGGKSMEGQKLVLKDGMAFWKGQAVSRDAVEVIFGWLTENGYDR